MGIEQPYFESPDEISQRERLEATERRIHAKNLAAERDCLLEIWRQAFKDWYWQARDGKVGPMAMTMELYQASVNLHDVLVDACTDVMMNHPSGRPWRDSDLLGRCIDCGVSVQPPEEYTLNGISPYCGKCYARRTDEVTAMPILEWGPWGPVTEIAEVYVNGRCVFRNGKYL